MYYAYVFLKHKGSTGGTQQEVSLRYNLFTFTHRHACKVKLNVSKPPGDETTLRPRLLYISCTITDCCLILMWFILFMCHFYIFFQFCVAISHRITFFFFFFVFFEKSIHSCSLPNPPIQKKKKKKVVVSLTTWEAVLL